MINEEIWKPYNDYEVSNLGRVRKGWRIHKNHIQKKATATRVIAYVGHNRSLAKLVAELFLPSSQFFDLKFKDGNVTNCAADNLEWYGQINSPERSGLNPRRAKKLTPDQVVEIRSLRNAGNTLQAIADMYDVDHTTVWQIEKGKLWQHAL